jgi:ubiquinone/menaquinone biosynthesis C-methylase UbiE
VLLFSDKLQKRILFMDKNQKFDNCGDNEQEQRFSHLQQLKTFYIFAPHQAKMQVLVGNAVVEGIKRLKNENSALEGNVEVVEIRVGKGFTAREILKADSNIKLISVDNDEGMIAQAKENLDSYIQEGRLELHTKDALEFLKKFPDNSIQIIASGFMLHNLKNSYREDILAEIYRVLKLGGEFITADKIMPDNKEFFEKEVKWQSAQFDKIPDPIERMKWIDHYDEDMEPDTIMFEGEITKTLEEIGFIDIRVSDRQHLDVLLIARK